MCQIVYLLFKNWLIFYAYNLLCHLSLGIFLPWKLCHSLHFSISNIYFFMITLSQVFQNNFVHQWSTPVFLKLVTNTAMVMYDIKDGTLPHSFLTKKLGSCLGDRNKRWVNTSHRIVVRKEIVTYKHCTEVKWIVGMIDTLLLLQLLKVCSSNFITT